MCKLVQFVRMLQAIVCERFLGQAGGGAAPDERRLSGDSLPHLPALAVVVPAEAPASGLRVWGVDGRQLRARHLGKEGGETRVGPHDDAESGGGCAGAGVLPPVGDGRQNGRPAEAGVVRETVPQRVLQIYPTIFSILLIKRILTGRHSIAWKSDDADFWRYFR